MPPLLHVNQVTHYFGNLCAVSDFSLKLDAGELVGIIGPNGAGKTTIFNLLTGVYRPRSGRITFREREIIGRMPNQITAMGIARTFQNIRLFQNLSVFDNVRVAHYAQVKSSLLNAFMRFRPHRMEEERIADQAMTLLSMFAIDAHAGELARNLPYGLQRRLEIARALATRPQLLLLDEPAAGMNPNEIQELMSLIQWMRNEFGLTILLIEHQMRLVMGICERLLVLDFGRTIAQGLPTEIQRHPRVLEAYLGQKSDDEHW